ncbi:MAG: ABC transporter permease [Trueperaceae bacterium]|nr:ABC transporter permease [Trueperaceae bacterium]
MLTAVPTLLVISFVIFAVLDLAPGDPTSDMPLTIPPEVRMAIRSSLGLDDPFLVKYVKWLRQFFVYEPIALIEQWTGISVPGFEGRSRVVSWQTRSPVYDLIMQRLPQTLWVVGLAYVFSVMIAIPVGVLQAYRQYSWFDQIGTFVSLIGFSVPTFFTGLLAIIIFSVTLRWLPSIYDTTLVVRDWPSFVQQVRQMVMPVVVLTLFQASQLSRFMRSSMLDNLGQDYARTARAKGLKEQKVVMGHVFRNSLIPVVTLVALGIPGIFTGAIVTEQIFRVNGLGDLLIRAIYASDIPMVQSISFIFAVLIVAFNILADVVYGLLDPRIKFD